MGADLVTRFRSRVFSDGSLTKKASLNSVATALNQGARAIVGFVVNPLLLRYLGDVTFGHWQVVYRLIGQTNPAGGRPSEALKWFIANRQSSDDLQVKRQAVASAIVVWLIFIPVLLPIGAVVGWFAPIWLHVPPADYAVVRLTAAVLVAGVVIMGLTNIPWAALAGENLGYKRMGITAAFEFVGGGLMVVAAVSGAGLVGLAVATVVVTVMSGALFLWLARRYIPWFGVARPDGICGSSVLGAKLVVPAVELRDEDHDGRRYRGAGHRRLCDAGHDLLAHSIHPAHDHLSGHQRDLRHGARSRRPHRRGRDGSGSTGTQ